MDWRLNHYEEFILRIRFCVSIKELAPQLLVVCYRARKATRQGRPLSSDPPRALGSVLVKSDEARE